MLENENSVVGAIRKALSAERFNSYRVFSTEKDLDLLCRYVHNVILCETLYPVLHVAEIVIRNAIDHAVGSAYPSNSDGAYNTVPHWLDARPSILHANDQTRVQEVIEALKKGGKAITPHRLVAGLSFGFWLGMLSKQYEIADNRNATNFWPRLLKAVTPHAPNATRTRQNLYQQVAAVRDLRNRVFHHEPIWRDKTLPQKHADLHALIAWISPETQKIVAALDRFKQVWEADRNGLKQVVQTSIK